MHYALCIKLDSKPKLNTYVCFPWAADFLHP